MCLCEQVGQYTVTAIPQCYTQDANKLVTISPYTVTAMNHTMLHSDAKCGV